MVSAAWRPDWIATCDTPGSSPRFIRSPITNTSGWLGSVQSSSTFTRPARSRSTPAEAARSRPSGEAWTPAAQIFVAASIRRSGASVAFVSSPRSSTCVTVVPRWISMPMSRRSCIARRRSDSGKAPRIVGAASSSTIRASAGSMRRKLWRSEWRDSSASCPASSTPVGPAPTMTNVRKRRRETGSGSRSAISNAPRTRPRSSSASSIVFIPGASCANSGCPKYDGIAPVATIRSS